MPPGSIPTKLDAVARIRGLATGLAIGTKRAFVSLDVARGELALVTAVARVLADDPTALEALVDRWLAVAGAGQLRPETRIALDWLRVARMPPRPGAVPADPGVLARFLPIAVVAGGSPNNLVSGTYHLAALFDPDPESLWSAVAVNVAAAQFLHGRRDFVADAIEAARVNQAPESVLAALRRIPFEPEAELAGLAGLDPRRPVDCMHLALWFAHREPRAGVALERASARDPHGWLVPLTAALLGARDGPRAIEESPTGALGEELDRLLAPLTSVRKET
jgi:hypothetical protein